MTRITLCKNCNGFAEQMRGADGEKIAVLRKIRTGSKLIKAAAHAHVMYELEKI